MMTEIHRELAQAQQNFERINDLCALSGTKRSRHQGDLEAAARKLHEVKLKYYDMQIDELGKAKARVIREYHAKWGKADEKK